MKRTKTAALLTLCLLAALGIVAAGLHRKNASEQTDSYPEYPRVHIDEGAALPVMKEAVLAEMLPPEKENQACFCSLKIYSAEQPSQGRYYVYTWVVDSTFSYSGEGLRKQQGSYPCRFELVKEDDAFKLAAAEVPADGAGFVRDKKRLFPEYVREQMDDARDDSTVTELNAANVKQAETYFKKIKE